jgi:hypothetical protein
MSLAIVANHHENEGSLHIEPFAAVDRAGLHLLEILPAIMVRKK